MRLGIVGFQFQRPAATGSRFVQVPLLLEGKAQIIVRLGIPRIQFQRPAVTGDRFIHIPPSLERIAKVIVECRLGPHQADRPSNVLDRNLVLARLRSDHAEKMERVGLVRRDRENPPIDLLGSLKLSRLVVPDRTR